jgi:DNA transformation protein
MGDKGARSSEAGQAEAESLVHDLAQLGAISSRKMFGGHGVFREDRMFAIVDSDGRSFFKVSPDRADRYDAVDAPRHAHLPYREIPVTSARTGRSSSSGRRKRSRPERSDAAPARFATLSPKVRVRRHWLA